MRNEILVGHILDQIDKIPDNSIHIILCSPPYWGKRDYQIPDVIFPVNKWYSCDKWIAKHNWEEAEKQPTKFGRDGNTDEVWEGAQTKTREGYTSFFCKQCGAWKGQLGLEPYPQLFVTHLINIFELLKPKLVDYGSLWVNLGDTYHGGNLTYKQPENWKSIDTHSKEERFGKKLSNQTQTRLDDFVQLRNKYTTISKKSLAKIPERFGVQMVDNGWVSRNDILWYKTNPKPESMKDRFTTDRELIMWFTKKPRKYYFKQQFEQPKSIDKIVSWTKNINSQALSKFNSIEDEKIYRAGMHKDRGQKMIKKRNLPDPQDFATYMKNVFIRDVLEKKTMIPRTTIDHWYRYDEGFSFPSIEDWETVQKVFNIKAFSELIKYKLVPDDIKSSKNGMRNMRQTWLDPTLNLPYFVHLFLKEKMNDFSRWLYEKKIPLQDVWNIKLKSSKVKHYAMYPKELVEIPIKSTCPLWVCKNCQSPKDWGCKCESEYVSPIVLDPFAGSGTTIEVALELQRDWLAIEIKPEYIQHIRDRVAKMDENWSEKFI